MAKDRGLTVGRIVFGPDDKGAEGSPLRKVSPREIGAYVRKGSQHQISYMIVTYKCGCEVRGREADHVCPNHPTQGIRKALKQLKDLGESLWGEMLENEVVTRNAGITSFSYCPYVSQQILDRIDELIASAYVLPAETTQYLKDAVWRTVVAGREDEMASNPALRRWMSGGGTK